MEFPPGHCTPAWPSRRAKNLAIELAYRHTNLGDGITGDVITYTGTNSFNNPTTFKDITSHDV